MWHEYDRWEDCVHVITACSSMAFNFSARKILNTSQIPEREYYCWDSRIRFIYSNPIKDYLERAKEKNEQQERKR